MKKLVFIFMLLLIFGLSATATTAYYFYNEQQKTKKLLEDPDSAARMETQSILDKVGKLIELPEEQASIATVIDKDKLKDQPFFSKSENGDKVLIYTQARKAILYRSTTNKVIDVAPLTIGQQATPSATRVAGDQTQRINVEASAKPATSSGSLTSPQPSSTSPLSTPVPSTSPTL